MSKQWSDYVDTGRTPMYSESFKRKVVAEVESGLLNKDEARRKYNIGGKTTILRWCRKYGKLSGGKINPEESMPDNNELLKKLEISMTETGDPRENAIAERINRMVKHEFGLKSPVRSIAEVKTLVEQAVLLYNNMRPHMSCHLQTPSQAHLSTSFANERSLKFICEPFSTTTTNKSVNLFQDKTLLSRRCGTGTPQGERRTDGCEKIEVLLSTGELVPNRREGFGVRNKILLSL